MVWKHPLDKEEKNMQINKVFENVKERTIRENEKNKRELFPNKGKKAAIVITYDELEEKTYEEFAEMCIIAKEQGFEVCESESGCEFWGIVPTNSLDDVGYTRLIMQLAPMADAIFIDKNVYDALDYIEQTIFVAGMKLINVEVREVQSGVTFIADPIYEHEIQRALAKRVAISPIAKDPNQKIAEQAILYELVVVMSNIWKCERVKPKEI
mgnify:FL=1|jgi:hypothetical protein